MSAALLPCPFCGSEPERGRSGMVWCPNAGCLVVRSSEDDEAPNAVTAWNRRDEAAALRARVAVLEARELATRERAAEAERENARLRAWIDDALEAMAQTVTGAALASVAEPQPEPAPVVVTVHV